MTLRNKLARVLDEQSGRCLDDTYDVKAVLDALVDAIAPKPLEFNQACEALRWHVTTDCGVTAAAAKIILNALGEA